MPSMAKIEKKKIAKPKIPPRDLVDWKRVSIRIRIGLKCFNIRSGLNRRKVQSPYRASTYFARIEAITRVRSSQFQGSFK